MRKNKLFTTLFTVLFSCFVANAQYTTIPDVNFELALIQLGYDSGAIDHQVLTDTVAGITTLDVSNKNISDLTGIQDFVSLQTLNCKSNQLQTLDVSKNIALTYLNCNSNQLTTLDVSKNTALTYLSCGLNQLTTLDVSKNTTLTYLACVGTNAGNKLTSLDVSKNTALTNLNCSSNHLTALDVTKNTALKGLSCDDNQLTVLDVSKNTGLGSLSCDSNQLTVLDVTQNTALGSLNCDSNQLTVLDVTQNTALGSLNCDLNQLTVLDVTQNTALGVLLCFDNQLLDLDVSKNTGLTELECSYNQLTTLDVSKNTALTYLDCSYNQLVSLNIKSGNNTTMYTLDARVNSNLTCIQADSKTPPNNDWYKDATASYSTTPCLAYTAIPDVNFEQALIKLGYDSGAVDHKVLTASIASIISLDVHNMSISDLTGLQDFVALTSLDCSSNQLTSLEVIKNKALQAFVCRGNLLAVLNMKNGNNSKITHFDSTNNPNLTCIQADSFTAPNSDWYKDATANYGTDCYTAIPDSNFEQALIAMGYDTFPIDHLVLSANISGVTNLDVSFRNISNLTGIQDFLALKMLDCKSNQLTALDVTKNTALTSLTCYGNQLTSLNITQNTALIDLNSRSNQLTALDVSKNTALNYLDCGDNQLAALDVSKNTALTNLHCDHNQLTALGVNNNTALTTFQCNVNQLTVLNLSMNTNLQSLGFSENQLAVLNIKNGNNSKITYLDSTNNPNLTCIQADSSTAPNSDWYKDATANYGTDCYALTYTAIPDSNFEQALISMGYDFGSIDHQVLTANIASITTLKVSFKNIANLTGIQDFVALKTLNCGSNSLKALDVTKNTALTYLSCGSNHLTAVDVTNNLALTSLFCGSNQLTALDLSKNTALIFLGCESNQLFTLNVTQNTALIFLTCFSNQLVNLNVKNGKNSNLTTFYADGNPNLKCIQADSTTPPNNNWSKDPTASYSTTPCIAYTAIPDVNFEQALIGKGYDSGAIDHKVLTSNIANVTSLDVLQKNILNLTGIQDFVSLQSLNCSSNQITALDVSKNTALTQLKCSNNQLAALDVSKNTALTYFDCSYNQLTVLDVSLNTALIYLDCSHNKLGGTNGSIKMSFLTNTTVLDVSHNTALTYLDCSYNQLTSLDVTKNTTLTYLDCSHNQLVTLNINNGNNSTITTFNATVNPSLTAIQADKDTASNGSNWTIDSTAYYVGAALASSSFDKKENSISVYPNPTHGMINIEMNQDITEVVVTNLIGQQLMNQLVGAPDASGQARIDISSLSEGTYLLKVISGDTSKVIKVIKN